ncbi:hypothetical protein VA603_15900 [Stenotrophomonas sp. MH1]|uniref:Uncharacterized protein n=1 Tax=Stenotrophomonas capsici TaxID=3110230 RepID=A0ABU5V8G6_9GAMM|nr:hypothetical protein [Stenotrophomonas sp. MH1]MEA5669029.1 hypothetical protein [Stenotrophomonas sp. MH1]
MTLVEFLHPLKAATNRDICLAALYFQQRYESVGEATVDGLRALLRRGKVKNAKNMNVADVLSKAAPYVHQAGKQGQRILWALTASGQDRVRELLQLPANDVEIENDVATLDALVNTVPDKDVADYLHEAVKCLQVNALRATVVFLWSAVTKEVRDRVFANGASVVDAAVAKHDKSPRRKAISKSDDLTYVKEKLLIQIASDLGVFDSNEKGVLEGCLDLRNKCGHPGKYNPGPKKVSSFIEDVIGIVFK